MSVKQVREQAAETMGGNGGIIGRSLSPPTLISREALETLAVQAGVINGQLDPDWEIQYFKDRTADLFRVVVVLESDLAAATGINLYFGPSDDIDSRLGISGVDMELVARINGSAAGAWSACEGLRKFIEGNLTLKVKMTAAANNQKLTVQDAEALVRADVKMLLIELLKSWFSGVNEYCTGLFRTLDQKVYNMRGVINQNVALTGRANLEP